MPDQFPKPDANEGEITMRAVSTDWAPKAIGPFAQAIVVDGWTYTSGQVPLSASGETVNGGIVQ